MRIPPSVIVMSIVIAVPFGLAIRDARSPIERVPLVDPVQEALATQHKVRRDAAEAEARAAHARVVAGLIGTERATSGPTLAGLALGEPADAPAIDAATALPFERVSVMRGRDQRIVAIEIVLEPDDCALLGDRLIAAWGPRSEWLDRARHHRASLTDCHLALDVYADPADWLALVHDELVGGSLDRALAVLGPATDLFENDYSWWLPGLGSGSGPTHLDLYVRDGKVQSMKLLATAPATDAASLRDVLAGKLHAKPVEDGDGGSHAWSWPRRSPPITLGTDDTTVGVEIGDLP